MLHNLSWVRPRAHVWIIQFPQNIFGTGDPASLGPGCECAYQNGSQNCSIHLATSISVVVAQICHRGFHQSLGTVAMLGSTLPSFPRKTK